MHSQSHDVEAGGQISGSGEQNGAGSLGQLQFYLPQLVTEAWRRVKMEFVVELPMLRQRWLLIVFGIVMQYVHGIFTQLAHRLHHPQDQPLPDLGFDMTPELGPEHFWVSEAIFATLFIFFVCWTFTPFFLQRKRFYTVVMWSRLLMVLVVCQALRITTFSMTQLPGPSYHCRAGEETSIKPWPSHWSGHIVFDLSKQVTKSCGDLIFSSHTTFLLTGILAYTEYGSIALVKVGAWISGVIVCTLIVASRKHYTVDIVIAWYTVPLVFYTLHRRWTTHRPMAEFLVALGENDEPDPDTPVERQDGVSGQELDQVKVLSSVDKSGLDVKALLSNAKERSSSIFKLQAFAKDGGIEGEAGQHGAGNSSYGAIQLQQKQSQNHSGGHGGAAGHSGSNGGSSHRG